MCETWRKHQHLINTQEIPKTRTLTLMVVARGSKNAAELPADLTQAMHLLHQTINH